MSLAAERGGGVTEGKQSGCTPGPVVLLGGGGALELFRVKGEGGETALDSVAEKFKSTLVYPRANCE